MHVAQLNFLPAPGDLGIEDLLGRWPSLADIAEMAAASGVRISVLQAASQEARLVRNGIDYRFVDVSRTNGAASRGRCFARVLAGMDVDLLHSHGLCFIEDASAVAGLPVPTWPVLVQDHADRVPSWWRRPRQRGHFAVASGVAFTSLEQAQPFVEAGMFHRSTRLFAIPESSSRFTPGDRTHARSETGLYGDPCVLWVGRLTRGKDPLTVLEGVARVASRLPGLRLWCAFGAASMQGEVRARIDGDPRLAGRVHLLGRVPHAQVETLLRASDLFVSGSRAEGSGYAAMEAIACGIVPVLTDIPAFRALTDNGRIGYLWPCGDAAWLAEALLLAATGRISAERVRAHFDATLSFDAVGRLWSEAYSQVLDGWRRRAA